MFEVIPGSVPFPSHLRGAVLAIGNFDGVHRGHQGVINAALEIAAREKRPALALTFEPHPRGFFQPGTPLFRLTPPRVKTMLFDALGLTAAMVKTFDAGLARMSAADFVASLSQGVHAAHLVAGHDFHFGKGRSGTPELLRELAREHGMQATLVPPVQDESGHAVSSSAIRAALEQGDVIGANARLGYRWLIEGEVAHGDKRGHALGFPTANIALPETCRLKHGVYAGRAKADGFWFGAALHFGARVQFGGGAPVLEAHLIDFSGDLYGKTLRIEFIAFERAEAKFDDVQALARQMGRDVDAVRDTISQVVMQPVGELQNKLERK